MAIAQITIAAPTHDFTPRGKRRVRAVGLTGGTRLRWYVSGRIYRTLPVTANTLALSREWLAAPGNPSITAAPVATIRPVK